MVCAWCGSPKKTQQAEIAKEYDQMLDDKGGSFQWGTVTIRGAEILKMWDRNAYRAGLKEYAKNKEKMTCSEECQTNFDTFLQDQLVDKGETK